MNKQVIEEIAHLQRERQAAKELGDSCQSLSFAKGCQFQGCGLYPRKGISFKPALLSLLAKRANKSSFEMSDVCNWARQICNCALVFVFGEGKISFGMGIFGLC